MNINRTRFLLAGLLLSSIAAVAQSPSPAFTANGAFASTYFCETIDSAGSYRCLNVAVSRGGTTSTPTTFLFYNVYYFDVPSGDSIQYDGSGQIPNSAFQVQGRSYSLNVDTSTVPGFGNYYCNTLFGCGNYPGWPIEGTWTEITPSISMRVSGSQTFNSPDVKTVYTGTEDEYIATSTVTFGIGWLVNTQGYVGAQHNTNIYIQRQ